MARKKRIVVPAHCHPDRELYANGLCGVCFFDSTRVPVKAEDRAERQALVELHKGVEYVVNLGKQAKAILRENLPRYAELHLTAAEIAAADGDARPAEWALESVIAGSEGPAATPPVKGGTGGEGGVKVFIGIKMGGLPEEALQVTATSAPPDV